MDLDHIVFTIVRLSLIKSTVPFSFNWYKLLNNIKEIKLVDVNEDLLNLNVNNIISELRCIFKEIVKEEEIAMQSRSVAAQGVSRSGAAETKSDEEISEIFKTYVQMYLIMAIQESEEEITSQSRSKAVEEPKEPKEPKEPEEPEEPEEETEEETDWDEDDEELKKTIIPHHNILRKYIKNLPKGFNEKYLPATIADEKCTESIILPADRNTYNQDITYYYNPDRFKIVEGSKTYVLEYIKKV